VKDLLGELLPHKAAKHQQWVETLAGEDIDTEEDVQSLSDKDFDNLPISAVLKSALRQVRPNASELQSSIKRDSNSPCSLPSSTSNATSKYTEKSILGQGAFGITVLAHEKQTGEARALKKIHCPGIMEANVALSEAHAMLRIRGDHFVECFDCFLVSLELGAFCCFIVMEYCDGGDLEAQVCKANENGQPIDERQIRRWLSPIACALHVLHSKHGMTHRDVKLSNILLAGNPPRSKLW
jgi:hypothetical protein